MLLISNGIMNNNFNFNILSTGSMAFDHVLINDIAYVCMYLVASSIGTISLYGKETYQIKRNNMDKLVLIYISILMCNVLLLLISLSIYIISSNRLIIVHYILLIISIILINKKNNIEVLIILIIICIDIISILNIMLILTGNNMWYYMLYQGIMSMYMWYSYIGSVYVILICIYYYKLGLGIGGYYIPGLYSQMMNNIYLFIYIGLANIVLMYNPILIFSSISSSSYMLILFNFVLVLIIIYIWISSGYLYMDIWLYSISFSTIVLSNIYYLLSSINIVYYNLYYYLYYFTFSSMIIWIIFIYTYCYVTYFNNNNNSSYISISNSISSNLVIENSIKNFNTSMRINIIK